MALIMYLNRAPKYDGVSEKDIRLMNSYFEWKRESEIGSRYACETFEKWNGHSEKELPNKDVINYYKQFFTKKPIYNEGFGERVGYTLFEHLGRFAKMNQIFQWFINNVMNGSPSKEMHEVSEQQLKNLLEACKKVQFGFEFVEKNERGMDIYSVNESIAKELLPVMENTGFFFGVSEYNEFYAYQINKAIDIIENVLKTTDFKKQSIYFNAIW